MNFNCDEETRSIKTMFNTKINSLFGDVFKLNKLEAHNLIEDPEKISTMIRRLEDFYKDSLDLNDIDESIFIRESRVSISQLKIFHP